jgi:hypothetical protein
VALAAGGLGISGSCAAVLGVDDYRDAVAEVCKCEQLSFLGSVQDCQATLTRRLDGASEETRAKWLAKFADDDCATCNKSLRCFYTAPTCSVGSCGNSEECCGANNGTGYCSNGNCFKEPEDCLPTGAPCESADECCGSEQPGIAACDNRFGGQLRCAESCAQGGANCPGCCTVFFVEAIGQTYRFCGDQRDEEACAVLCDPELPDPCPVQGTSCQQDCGSIAEGVCLFICK